METAFVWLIGAFVLAHIGLFFHRLDRYDFDRYCFEFSDRSEVTGRTVALRLASEALATENFTVHQFHDLTLAIERRRCA